jgi:hypothetical protein
MRERPVTARLQFRVLYRQFVLRIVDLEALSSKADVIKLLGQLASILVMFSVIQALLALIFNLNQIPVADRVAASWTIEHHLIAMTMLVVGLFAVLTWESTFPDRRDMMLLGPLPVRARTIFLAKVAASGTALSLSVLALNGASGLTWPVVLATPGILGMIRSVVAYWTTMLAAGVYLYCSMLILQGVTAHLFPRRLFLRVSAVLQLTAFSLFLGVYFLQPEIAKPAALATPEDQRLLAWLPSYWFLGLFNKLNGSMQPELLCLERRAWIGLAVAVFGAGTALLLSYIRTLRKIVEEPDIVPGAQSSRWSPGLGNSLQTAVIIFSLRSLLRSRQHRVVVAFYLGIGFAIALSTLNLSAAHRDISDPSVDIVGLRLLIASIVMLSFAVVGIRVAFSMPIALPANWIFRITELRPLPDYIAANTRALMMLAVVPVAAASAVIALPVEPLSWVVAHLLVLTLLGSNFVGLSLLGFHKIPLTCSYLPGKSNVQFAFWAYVLLLIRLTEYAARFEQRALQYPARYAAMLGVLAILPILTWGRTRWVTRSAVLQFEEAPPVDILELGLNRD